MNSMIIYSLKERKKLNKVFAKNSSDFSKNSSKRISCIDLFLHAKSTYIATITAILDSLIFAQKTYWLIISIISSHAFYFC